MSIFVTTANRLDRLPLGPALLLGVVVGGGTVFWMRQLDWSLGVVVVGLVVILAALLGLSAAPLAGKVLVDVEEVLVDVEEVSLDIEEKALPPLDPKPGQEWTNPMDGSVLVYVPEGTYTLGAENLDKDSRPVHRVHLSGFWIGRDPITNGQYRRFLELNPEAASPKFWDNPRFNGDRQPVIGVDWNEARAYCRWAGLGLPTEAQWEAAARGMDERRFPWGNAEPKPELAHFGQSYETAQPAEVGRLPLGVGPFGTRDQAGNVWEWCLDPWDAAAYMEREGKSNPVAEGAPAVRVVRGGSWGGRARNLRSAIRGGDGVGNRGGSLGFRCAGVVPSEPLELGH